MELIKGITGRTRVLGIIGNPVDQSMSPVLHNTLAKMLGIDMVYVPFLVKKDELKEAVKGLVASGIDGLNVTIPFKVEIMKYIDEITDDARLAGAINTVKVKDGKLIGYNTDGYGFEKAYYAAFGTGFNNKKITVIGAGGTGTVICQKLAMSGAKEVFLLNRTFEKSITIAEFINKQAKDIVKPIHFSDPIVCEILSGCDVIINTTSVGMVPNTEGCSLPSDFEFKKHHVAYDVVYKPNSTVFLNKAKSVGAKTLNGADMLFYQGVRAFEIWQDISIDPLLISNVRDAFLELIKI